LVHPNIYYQKGEYDRFIHKYEYDAENRITDVYTSTDDLIWSNDVKYFYYLHGPLARVELGEHKVQGIDYAYTLQGWLKGVNSNSLSQVNDMGKDGLSINIIDENNRHYYFGPDVAGFSLAYFDRDYESIGQTTFLAEQMIYGSSRVGLLDRSKLNLTGEEKVDLSEDGTVAVEKEARRNILSDKKQPVSITPTPVSGKVVYTHATHTLGLKHYELTNHLGNVLTTVSDRKNTIATGAQLPPELSQPI